MPHLIRSPITGVVLSLEVSEGESVDTGTTLLMVESMKVEIPVPSDRVGQVSRIAVDVGASISEGDVVVELA